MTSRSKPAKNRNTTIHSVHVAKKNAEATLSLLRKLELLNERLRIRSVSDHVLFPLLREAVKTEKRQLQEIDSHRFGEDQFEELARTPRTIEDALAGIVPEAEYRDLPKSFDIIGDIAVLEVKQESARFEKQMGEAILRVHPNVRTVLAKEGPISGADRIRPVHHVTGERRTTTIHKEFGCSFKVDLSKAFFSPRLSTEHERVATLVGEHESVVDMFAGVGPFSILIAKTNKQVHVDSIDANAEAASLMRENVHLNKVEGKVRIWNGDARKVTMERLEGTATRVIMNHPSAAEDFLDSACAALAKDRGIIHYYTFMEGDDCEEKAIAELATGVGIAGYVVEHVLQKRRVREVAPYTWQVVVDARVARRA
ncbi:MAG TPA: class I SAM-dependent methyltransferase family protein [Candidatus Bathyarchaeia archaeon]|nr:class I SAM-dependent methyltransferase family protein [Candidatus Bathyarchaeia archaeon]